MPRQKLMSYEGAPNYRWVKMYKGERYRVTCEQLGAMIYTEEATWKLANEWWRKKLAELNRPSPEQEMLYRYQVQDLKETIEKGQAARAILAALPVGEDVKATAEEVIGIGPIADDTRRIDLLGQVVGKLGGEPVQTDKTLSHQVGRFLAHEQARGKAALTFADVKYFLDKLVRTRLLPGGVDVSKIGGTTITDLYAWLRNESGWAEHSQHKAFNHFRRLVRWLWGESLIELPRNLDLKTWTFDDGAKHIKTYKTEVVNNMLANLTDRLRLYALLALNCGMLPVDMAMLRLSEYQDGRITRKRSKTKKRKTVPTVEYVLWPETVAALDKYPSKHEEFVLTSSTGTPLWKTEVRNGKSVRVDLIGRQWRMGRGEGQQTKPPIPLKALRSVSATILESNKDYARFGQVFLGHAPSTMKDRHYSGLAQSEFDAAILWLRQQILG
jgi:integrase